MAIERQSPAVAHEAAELTACDRIAANRVVCRVHVHSQACATSSTVQAKNCICVHASRLLVGKTMPAIVHSMGCNGCRTRELVLEHGCGTASTQRTNCAWVVTHRCFALPPWCAHLTGQYE